MSMSAGKMRYMDALSNEAGVIAAAAMDQRGSLRKSIGKARGVAEKDVPDVSLEEFKAAVSRILTPYATAILLDTEFGLPAAKDRAKNAGLLLAYEETGYDATDKHRMPDLLPHLSVKRLVEFGADAVKILLYYTPFSPPDINDIKHAFIERVGAECVGYDIPFFLEFVTYDENGADEKALEYAQKKPSVVKGAMLEFSKPEYHVDVLKVEVPINAVYVEGSRAHKGRTAYTRAEALDHFRDAASVATKPFIYLSAGVTNEIFIENLEFAAESGTDYSGVLCGRATWADGMAIYAVKGVQALEDWLSDVGVKNIQAVNEAVKSAKSWKLKAGVPSA